MFSKLPWASHQNKATDQQQPNNPSSTAKPDSTSTSGQQETSLTTILSTAEDRAALLMLIATCSDNMRQTIMDNFDPEQTDNPPILPPRPSDEPEPPPTTSQTPEEKQKTEQDAREKARKERERRVKELSAPKMQELKAAALEYFEDWKAKVFERVGEAVNEGPPPSTSTSPRTQNADTDTDTVAQKPRDPDAAPPRAATHIDDMAQQDKDSITALHELYAPVSTPLKDLPQPERVVILHSLLLLLLSLERYSADSRILLLQVTSALHLPLSTLTEDESKVARGLLEAAAKQMSADEETKRKASENAFSRKWKVGLGAVAGAALIGVTGGLAAPLLAAGVGTVMGGLGLGTTAVATYLGALAGSAPLVGILFGAYGGRMTGQVVDQYAKEISDFAFVPVRKASVLKDDKELRRLRVAIGISGWLTRQDDVLRPWHVLAAGGTEAFALRWELEALMKLGSAMTTYVRSAAWTVAKTEIIKRTVFGALSAGLWPLALVKVSRVVDNPFSVARARAEKVGEVLADALINKVQGERPVTLVGYSLGARAIYSCLNTLAERRAFGLVESVVLLGAPTPSDAVAWRRMRAVVSGRLVNVYSANDYLLGFLYRTSSLQYGIAGLQPVRDIVGIENVDVSGIVDGHTRYRFLTGTILQKIGFEDVDTGEVEKQEKALRQEERKEEEERLRKEGDGASVEEDEEQLQKEVDKKSKEGMISWMGNKLSAVGIGGGSSQKNATNPSPSQPDLADNAHQVPGQHRDQVEQDGPQHRIEMIDDDDEGDGPPPPQPPRPQRPEQDMSKPQAKDEGELNLDSGPAPRDSDDDKTTAEKAATTIGNVLIPGPS